MVLKQAILFSTIPARKPGQLRMYQPGNFTEWKTALWVLILHLTSCPGAWTFQHFPLMAEGKKHVLAPPWVQGRSETQSTCGSNLQIGVKPSWAQFSSLLPSWALSYKSGKGIGYHFKPLNFSICPWNTTVETVAQRIYDLKKLHNSGVGIIVSILH